MKIMQNHNVPFWGEPDANVNWCENDYVVSRYIAEFWNTISSLFIVLLGLHGLLMHNKKYYERRHSAVFFILSIVGIGSALFHCTLRKTGQMLDEIPMVLGNHALLYSSLLVRNKTPSPAVLYGILISAIFHTIIYLYFQWFTIFVVLYTLGWFFQTKILLGWMYEGFARTIYPQTWLCIYLSFGCYIGGFVLWLIENVFCDSVQGLQLHAIWHVAAGIATYYWNLVLMIQRLHFLKRHPELRRTPLFRIHKIVVVP